MVKNETRSIGMTMSTKGYHDSSPHCIAVVVSVVLAMRHPCVYRAGSCYLSLAESLHVYWASSDDAFPLR